MNFAPFLSFLSLWWWGLILNCLMACGAANQNIVQAKIWQHETSQLKNKHFSVQETLDQSLLLITKLVKGKLKISLTVSRRKGIWNEIQWMLVMWWGTVRFAPIRMIAHYTRLVIGKYECVCMLVQAPSPTPTLALASTRPTLYTTLSNSLS